MNTESVSSHYHRRTAPELTAVVHRDWSNRFENLNGLIDQINRDPGQIRREGQGQGVTALREIHGQPFFVMVYMPGRLNRRLRDLLGNPRALLEWRKNVAAIDAGIDVAPMVLAASERRWWNSRHLVVTTPADGASVSGMLDNYNPSLPDLSELLQLMGQEIARFHRLGFFHRHLKATHLFLNDKRRFTLIDLEGSRIQRPLPAQLRQENLRQMKRSLKRYPITRNRYKELEEAYQRAWDSPSNELATGGGRSSNEQ